MIKIFEALQKSTGEIPEAVLLAGAEKIEPSGVAVENLSEPPQAVAPVVPAAKPHHEPPPQKPDPPVEVGTFHLNLSVHVPLFPRQGLAAEQYRIIRTKLIHHPKQPRTIAVVSPGSGDGKTVTSINLAGALSLKEATPVLLIDTDLRCPKIAQMLGMDGQVGLADVLARQIPVERAIVRIDQFPNLFVIPAGSRHSNPSELLDSQPWFELCADLRRRFDFLVLDTPPIGPVADYDLIQRLCDGVLLVLRPDHTKRRPALNALKVVPKDKLLGVITNAVEQWFLCKPHQPYYNYLSAAPSR